MENKSSAKQTVKKLTVGSEKQKKSNNGKKKKKSKKPPSDIKQSPDCLEVEGVQALDQQGGESDSSSTRNQGRASPENSQSKLSATQSKTETSVRKASPLVGPSSSQSKDNYLVNLKKNGSSTTSLEESLSNLSVRSKVNSQRSLGKGKVNNVKPGNSGSNLRNNIKQQTRLGDNAKVKIDRRIAESLRWENVLQDEEKEMERIRLYKINRRKRYLADAQSKGLSWVVNYGNNGMPLAENSGIEPSDIHSTTVTDFSTVRGLMSSSQNTTPISLGHSDYVY